MRLRITITAAGMMLASVLASADTIHLKNGRTILADHVRENGSRYEYEIGDDTYAIPKTSVDRIEAGGLPAIASGNYRQIFRRSRQPTALPTKAIFRNASS